MGIWGPHFGYHGPQANNFEQRLYGPADRFSTRRQPNIMVQHPIGRNNVMAPAPNYSLALLSDAAVNIGYGERPQK